MKHLQKPFYKHLIFWILFWFIQSLLFSGGTSSIDGYLVKNVAIVMLQAGIVYFNFYVLWRFLDKGKYAIYTLLSLLIVYLVLAVSKELIGMSFALITPDVRYIIINSNGWWPTDFWRILSGSAPYSIALLASTVYLLLKNRQKVDTTAEIEPETAEKASDPEENTLLLKEGKVVHRLELDDILFIQGMKEYVSWHTQDKKVITLHSLASLEDSLASKGFLRTHKSFIVNTRCVNMVKYDAVEIPGKRIPIGRSYREKVQGRFKSDV